MTETPGLDMADIMARADAALAEPADPSAGETMTSPVTAAPMGGTPADGFPPPVPAGHECETGCGRLFNVVLTWVATSETRILCDICTLVMFMRLAQDIPDLAAPAEPEPAPAGMILDENPETGDMEFYPAAPDPTPEASPADSTAAAGSPPADAGLSAEPASQAAEDVAQEDAVNADASRSDLF